MASRPSAALVLVLFAQTAGLCGGGTAPGERELGGGAAELVERAERFFKAGKLGDALAELETAVAQSPASPRPLVAMATVLLEARREREAVQVLARAAELHRHFPGLSSQESGDGADGFGIATRAGLLANLATWLYQTGDASGAADACQEALAVQTLHARCYYILGVAMLSSGQWREESGAHTAQRSLAASVRLFTTNADRANALFALGSLRLRMGHMAPAASSFEAALRLAPNRHEVLMRVGEMRSRLARHEAALEAFRAAERLRPELADATIQCGNALRRLKRLTKALAKYKEAAEHASASQWDKAEALYWIGSVRESQGKTAQAEKSYQKALAFEPNHARALNNMGSLLMARGDGSARALYRRATMADPHMFEAYNNLGGHLLVQGEAREAVPLLEWALHLDQTEPQLVFNLGLARRQAATAAARKSGAGLGEVEAGGGDDAVGLMRQALRMHPGNKDFYWELARTYLYSEQPGLLLATLEAMTRSLRGGWAPAVRAALDADKWIHESGEAAGLRAYAPAAPPVAPKAAQVRGVILFLCCADDDELRDLHWSLRRLHAFFTSRFQYPVLVLHDRLEAAQERSLEQAFSPSTLSFLKIRWDLPPDMSASVRAAVPPKLLLAGHSWSLGYRHMSRFFCKGLFELPELVDKYDYYWRLDADSFLLRPVLDDPFLTLRDSGRDYGYMVVTQEDESVVRGLWNTTLEYMRLRGLSVESAGFLHRHLTAAGEWNRNMFYTNFEISSLAFWRSPEYLDFFEHIDKSNGIYMHRWGDAPIHLLAVALLLPEARVLKFSHIAYWHQYYVNLPPA
jgi:alpha 1,2-mannosyltransferase